MVEKFATPEATDFVVVPLSTAVAPPTPVPTATLTFPVEMLVTVLPSASVSLIDGWVVNATPLVNPAADVSTMSFVAVPKVRGSALWITLSAGEEIENWMSLLPATPCRVKPLNVATPAAAVAVEPALIVATPDATFAVTTAVEVVALPEASAIRMTG